MCSGCVSRRCSVVFVANAGREYAASISKMTAHANRGGSTLGKLYPRLYSWPSDEAAHYLSTQRNESPQIPRPQGGTVVSARLSTTQTLRTQHIAPQGGLSSSLCECKYKVAYQIAPLQLSAVDTSAAQAQATSNGHG